MVGKRSFPIGDSVAFQGLNLNFGNCMFRGWNCYAGLVSGSEVPFVYLRADRDCQPPHKKKQKQLDCCYDACLIYYYNNPEYVVNDAFCIDWSQLIIADFFKHIFHLKAFFCFMEWLEVKFKSWSYSMLQLHHSAKPLVNLLGNHGNNL